jgi:hypothetical protein
MHIWQQQQRNVIALVVFVFVIWIALRVTAPTSSSPAPANSGRPASYGRVAPGVGADLTCPPGSLNQASGCVIQNVSTGR